jgi:chorismate--pyruvate lyase
MLGSMNKWNALPCDPVLRRWLQAEGSLTSRLRAHGLVEVQVQRQGPGTLWALEQADLRVHTGYVREVVLLLDGRPAVWARSVTTARAIQGAWRAMRGLGVRPLAELLFSTRHVNRESLQAQRLPRGDRQVKHIRDQWNALQQPSLETAMPRWARSSLFWRHGQALRVMEAFSPWMSSLAVN